MQEKAKNRSDYDAKQDSEIEKTIEELAKTNPEKAEVYRDIYEDMTKDPDKFVGQNIEELARIKINQIIEEKINKFANKYKVKTDDLIFYTSNYKDRQDGSKPLGEDDLIKNANKDLYNEASGENLSLLKFKSMLRKDTHKFINQKIRPYFEYKI